MVSYRQYYADKFPEIPEESWLNPDYDMGVSGMAERASQIVPVYTYSDLLALSKGSPGDKFKAVSEALVARPKAAILHTKLARKAFWEDVQAGRKIAWEGLHPAIKGLMAYGASAPHAVVYERGLVVKILASSVMDSDEIGEDPTAVALRDYATKMRPCDAGPPTPWYFFTL